MKKIILSIVIMFSLVSIGSEKAVYTEDVEKALIEKIVSENFEFPHYEVGAAFLSGNLLHRDFDKAIFWLAQSSEIEKNDKADYLLAEIYSKGLLKPEYIDPNKAMIFYERAAKRGNSEAKLKAAVNYLYHDVLFNQEKGLYWLNESMIDGNLTAYQLYSTLVMDEKDSPTILKQLDYVLARSEKGDHLSSFYLGLVYLKNNIVQRDLEKSKFYLLRAMAQGNLIAEEFVIQIDKINSID